MAHTWRIPLAAASMSHPAGDHKAGSHNVPVQASWTQFQAMSAIVDVNPRDGKR